MTVEIKKARFEHIPEVLNNLRLHDLGVFNICCSAEQVLREEIDQATMAFAGFINNQCACIWGVRTGTVLNDSAYLWLLTTKLIEEHPFLFVRHSQIVAKDLLKSYSKIHGWVLENNKLSVKWLKWLGCSLARRPEEPGVLSFELRRA